MWDRCPRSALKNVLEKIKGEHGFTFVLGQEIEFYVMRERSRPSPAKNQLPEPVDSSLYCQTWASDNMTGLMDDIAEAVESFSIPVEQLHAESGPGQFELVTAPSIGANLSLLNMNPSKHLLPAHGQRLLDLIEHAILVKKE